MEVDKTLNAARKLDQARFFLGLGVGRLFEAEETCRADAEIL